MVHLKDVKKPRMLTLTRVELTDKGLEQLARVTALEHLKALPALQSLSFRRTGFTDADVKAFAGFPKLTKLQLGRGRVTKSGLEKIRDELPGVSVGY